MSTPTPPTPTACEALRALDEEISRAFADAAISCGCDDIDEAEEYDEEAHEADCHFRVLNRVASDGVPMIRDALADAAALREQRDDLRGLLERLATPDLRGDGGCACDYCKALDWLEAHPTPTTTEPDGASGNRQGDRK